MPLRLATSHDAASATSRTWPTDAGRAGQVARVRASGPSRRRRPRAARPRASRARCRGRSRRAPGRRAPPRRPRRSARRRICAADSSPRDVERRAGRRPARQPERHRSSASTCRCPASRRAGRASPGTRPPPSTRSSSPMPVAQARRAVGARPRAAAPAAPARPAARARGRAAAGGRARRRRALLDERVPLAAAGALAVPLRGHVAAGGADEDRWTERAMATTDHRARRRRLTPGRIGRAPTRQRARRRGNRRRRAPRRSSPGHQPDPLEDLIP